MERAVIEATRRTVTGKKVGALRRAGKLPAVLYGTHMQATPITLKLRESSRILASASSSSLFNINLDGVVHAVLVREKQRNFITGILLHVDFQAISLTEKIRTSVNIVFTGLAPAVEDFNGVVVNGAGEVEVECFPQDLPEKIVVDISNLMKIGDAIYIRDIKVEGNVVILQNPEEMVVIITAPAAEEVVEEVVVAAAEEPEVIEKGKKEEEEEAEE
jgi:large subunit ribosomal protein L25